MLSSQPSLPITEVRIWPTHSSSWGKGQLTIPDRDTTIVTQSNSPLRNYDRHVARLFEMTYEQCQNNSALKGMNWNYEAANGNVFMGEFRLSCRTAREVVSGYGLTRGSEIPHLKIVNAKADRWMDYVQTIPPMFSAQSRQLEPMQKVLHSRIDAQVLPPVPLRFPQQTPRAMKVADRFVLKSIKQGYEFCPATVKGDCDRSSLYGFQQFLIRSGLELYSEKQFPAGTVYRSIELANKIPGVYVESCSNQACVSVVQWKQDGLLYELQAKYREQPVLVKIANSAIESRAIDPKALSSQSSPNFH